MSPRALASLTVVGEDSQSIFDVDFWIVFLNLKFQAILVNSTTNNSFIVREVLTWICFGISGTTTETTLTFWRSTLAQYILIYELFGHHILRTQKAYDFYYSTKN